MDINMRFLARKQQRMSSLSSMEKGAGRMFKSAVNDVARAQMKAKRILKKIENNYALTEEEKLIYDKSWQKEDISFKLKQKDIKLEEDEGSESSINNKELFNMLIRGMEKKQLPSSDSIDSSISELKLDSSVSNLTLNPSENLPKSESHNTLRRQSSTLSDTNSCPKLSPYMSTTSHQKNTHHQLPNKLHIKGTSQNNDSEKSEYDTYKAHNISEKELRNIFTAARNSFSISDIEKNCALSPITSDYASLESFASYSSQDGLSNDCRRNSSCDDHSVLFPLQTTSDMFDYSVDQCTLKQNNTGMCNRVSVNSVDCEGPITEETKVSEYTCLENSFTGKVHGDVPLLNDNQCTNDYISNLGYSSETINHISPDIFSSDSNIFTPDNVLSESDCFIYSEMERLVNLTEDLLDNYTPATANDDQNVNMGKYDLKKSDSQPVNTFDNILRVMSDSDIIYYSQLCDTLLEDTSNPAELLFNRW